MTIINAYAEGSRAIIVTDGTGYHGGRQEVMSRMTKVALLPASGLMLASRGLLTWTLLWAEVAHSEARDFDEHEAATLDALTVMRDHIVRCHGPEAGSMPVELYAVGWSAQRGRMACVLWTYHPSTDECTMVDLPPGRGICAPSEAAHDEEFRRGSRDPVEWGVAVARRQIELYHAPPREPVGGGIWVYEMTHDGASVAVSVRRFDDV
jgi:hypothetical protein